MINRLKYVGKGIIVNCDTQDIVSPRAVHGERVSKRLCARLRAENIELEVK